MRLKDLWPFQRKSTISDVIRDLYGGRTTRTGVNVTWKTALEVTTAFRCALVIADCLSTVPLRVFHKEVNARLPAIDHPLYELFATAPNDWQDTLQFRETLGLHAALSGNFFAFINRVRGRVVELIPIEPSRVAVSQLADYSLKYSITNNAGELRDFPQESIWHIRAPSWNGWMGLETSYYGREAIGLSAALERSHAYLHRNGVRASGVYSVDGTLNDKQMQDLRSYLTREMAGLDNTGVPIILDRAAKWSALAMSGIDAQHLETRRFQIEEVCRLFGVMPIMLGHSDKAATYASAEQMFLAHLVHTARPWHRRVEASIRKNLFTKEDRDNGYYAKFLDAELLRGAAKDRADFYAKGIQSGWLTRNEAREWEELDPITGLDEPLAPVNMTIGNPDTSQNNTSPEVPSAPAP